MQTRTLAALAALVLALSLGTAADSFAQDPGIRDTVIVDSVVAYTSGIGSVPVFLYNDEVLGGLEANLVISSPDVQIDSFSFVGSRLNYISVKGYTLRSSSVSFYAVPISAEPLIAPGSGSIGTVYLSWDAGISPQVAVIDTETFIDPNQIEYSTKLSTEASVTFVPEYIRGYVDIQQAFGCCVGMRGNVDNDPLDDVNISDVTYMVRYLFQGGPPPDCPSEADLDGVGGPDPNVADLTWLVAYVFKGGPPPVPCQ